MAYDEESFKQEVKYVLNNIEQLLVVKNRSYGNSFAEPANVFAKNLPADALIRIRLDDKISRLKNGTDELNEDTVTDIMGYLVLWEILKRKSKSGTQIELPGVE